MNSAEMDRIGRYQIKGELGRGAMGVVYRALDPAIGRTVAIKTIRLGDLADEAERTKLHDRLFREAQSAGILSHPGIVTIYDIADEDDLAYIAMECVNGPTLAKMLATEPPDGQLALSLLTQTAAALDYAHKRGIVHRDIKPANIIVHDGKEAKITDFGVARIQSHQMTQAGSMIGTPNYMSPEQIQGKAVDGRSDQYSLAVIAFEMLTGEKPFVADSLAGLAFQIVNEQAAPIHRLNPTLGWTVDTVVRKALSKSPEDRYPTCSDFVFALENACRACKEWKPMAAGAAADVATLVEAKPAAAPATPIAAPAVASAAAPPSAPRPFVIPEPAPLPPRPERKDPPRPPVVLRVLRLLALAVLGGVVISALLIGALRWFTQKPPESAANTPAVQEQPEVKSQKPSAMGDQRPQALPGDSTPPQGDSAATSAPKESKEEEQQPAPIVVEPPESPKPPPAARPQSARDVATRLITNPPGAFLVVDGKSETSCKSPCSIELPPGRHTLSATMEGYRRTLKIFELPADSENFLNLERTTGTVAVRSDPRGAAISVNGQARSERTPAILTLPTGRYSIEVALNGQRERRDIVVRESVITNLEVSFR